MLDEDKSKSNQKILEGSWLCRPIVRAIAASHAGESA